jgi:glycosyltransferase involved in cell wall biosynthesis
MINQLIIVCLSNQFFGSSLKTNKHLVMARMAERGHTVLFVDPPTRVRWAKHKLDGNPVQQRDGNLCVYTPKNLLHIPPLPALTTRYHSKAIGKFITQAQKGRLPVILWVYHFDFPRLWSIVAKMKPDVLVYDVVDSYRDFPEYSRGDSPYRGTLRQLQRFDSYLKRRLEQNEKAGVEWVISRERELATRANLVFASHPLLYERFKVLNDNTHYLPNAGDFRLYAQTSFDLPPIELRTLNRPIVGYSGALDAYKFDFHLLRDTALAMPEVNFVLIGPLQVSDSSDEHRAIEGVPNVHLLGIRSFEDTALYVQHFDAYVIPYIRNNYTLNGCFPVKLFNALAAGKPTIVTDLPAYRGLESVLHIVAPGESFAEAIRRAVAEDSLPARAARVQIAQANDWDRKVDKQLQLIFAFLQDASRQ